MEIKKTSFLVDGDRHKLLQDLKTLKQEAEQLESKLEEKKKYLEFNIEEKKDQEYKLKLTDESIRINTQKMENYQKAYDDMVYKGLSGSIRITDLELFLSIDTEFFRSVNPFIVFNIGNQKIETDSVKIDSKKKCSYEKVIAFEF